MKFLLIILFPFCLNAQTIDTLSHAKARANTFACFPFQGKMNNGHIYAAGFNQKFDTDGTALPEQLIRIDLTTNTVDSVSLTGTLSTKFLFWNYCFDSLGNFYLGLNDGNRKIFKFNLKGNTIQYKNLGNGFHNTGLLAYSMSLGLDKNVVFGSSGGNSFVCEYNPYTDTLIQYPQVSNQDYVLSVNADVNYIYAQTGQNDSLCIWRIKKSDGTKTMLFKDPLVSSRFTVETACDGYVYMKVPSTQRWYRMVNGDTVNVSTWYACRITYMEVNWDPPTPHVNVFYNALTSTLQYSGAATGQVQINSANEPNYIQLLMFDKTDTDIVYYVGQQYGAVYKYSISGDSTTALGFMGYNAYSWVQLNDSIILIGAYPNGALLKWNKNKAWTLQTLVNGRVQDGSETTVNPKLLGFFRSNTSAGFHHTDRLIKDFNGYIVGAGDVIRVGNSCSIAAYNPNTGIMTGYDYHKMPDSIGEWCASAWQDKVLLSTYNAQGGHPKIYVYRSTTNTMVDSIDLGYDNYGSLFVWGDKLIGITPNRIYKYDLAAKHLIDSRIYADNSISTAFMLTDGRIIINTANTLPSAFFWQFIQKPYNFSGGYYEFNGRVYYTDGALIKRIQGLAVNRTNTEQTLKRFYYAKNILGIN
jgi:hypothetical protein